MVFTQHITAVANDSSLDLESDEVDYAHSSDWQVAETEGQAQFDDQDYTTRKYGDLPPDYPAPDESEFEE